MKPIDISFSREPFDMWRLDKAGGYITFKQNGQAIFRFENKAQFEKYKSLNVERPTLFKYESEVS